MTEATDAELAGLRRSAEAFRGPLDADAFADAQRTFLIALVSPGDDTCGTGPGQRRGVDAVVAGELADDQGEHRNAG